MSRVRVRTAGERGGFHRTIGAMALMLLVAVFLASCGGDGEEAQQQVEGPPAPTEEQKTPEQAAGVTLSEIAEEPDEFYGQTVTVQGAVARVLDPNVFVLVDQQRFQDEEFFDDPEVLAEEGVLVASGDVPNLTGGQTVQVSGTVQPFDIAEFEDALVIDIEPDETFNLFQGRAAIVATSVEGQPGGETTQQMQETTDQ